jgi:hypothetical protein
MEHGHSSVARVNTVSVIPDAAQQRSGIQKCKSKMSLSLWIPGSSLCDAPE